MRCLGEREREMKGRAEREEEKRKTRRVSDLSTCKKERTRASKAKTHLKQDLHPHRSR